MKRKKIRTLSLATICLASIAVVGATVATSAARYSSFNASEAPAWKHFAAVMPTATTQGIREYWIDCVSEKTPHFTKPESVSIEEATLTQAQIDVILENQKDERIIPTLERIQTAVTKDVDGTDASHYTYVNEAYAYTYLDAATKESITGANVAKITSAKETFDYSYTCAFDAGKDTCGQPDKGTISKGEESPYGDVLVYTSTVDAGTGESWSWSAAINIDASGHDYVIFSIYLDQPTDLFAINADWTKSLDLKTGEVKTGSSVTTGLAYKAWNTFKIPAANWNEMGVFQIGVYSTYDLGYGVRTTGEPAHISSLIFKDVKEGAPVYRSVNKTTDTHVAGAGTTESVITYAVDTKYGPATQVDIKAKTSVLELEWASFDISKLENFDFVRFYVFAKTTQRVFVTLTYWRNNVVNIPGVEPFAEDNGAQANAVQSLANVVADQWNVIDIPASYLAQDPDAKIFVDIWADQNEAKDGWLFTDMTGHYSDCVLDNGGQLIAHNSATVAPVTDADLGACSRVTLTAARGYAKQNRTINIAGFASLTFKVKNETAASMKFLLYMLKTGVYGDEIIGKNKHFTVQVNAGETKEVEINIAAYFGKYASESSAMFAVDGVVGSTFLFSAISGKLA